MQSLLLASGVRGKKIVGRKLEQVSFKSLCFIAPTDHQLKKCIDFEKKIIPTIPPNISVNLCVYTNSGWCIPILCGGHALHD